jgi:integrase/recombinase XerC
MDELVKVDDSGAVVPVSSGITLSDFADRWIRYLDVAPRSVQTYSTNLKQFLLWLAKNGINQPTREDIIVFRDSLKATHRPSTIQGYMAAIRLFFQFLEMSGIYKNVALHIKSPKLDRGHKHDYLTSDQSKELLSTCDQPDNTEQSLRDKAILSVLLTTGIRTCSVINADIQDIGTVGDCTVLYYLGKGHTEKNVFVKLTPPVEHAIRQYLHVRGAVKDTDPLFASLSNRDKGNRLTTRSLRRMIKTRLRKIGIDNRRVSAHSLRHTAATLNLLQGGTLEETKDLLGHCNIETTLIYSHLRERVQNKSEERISNLLFS